MKDWLIKNFGVLGVLIVVGGSAASFSATQYLAVRDEQIRAKCERAANKEALKELKNTLDNMTRAFSSVATNLASLNTEVKNINNRLTEIKNHKESK